VEYSKLIDLPEDRCGFSDRGHTCDREAWHDGLHHMVPSSWIFHSQLRVGDPADRADIDALVDIAKVEEHQHVWGPFGCWCGASQHAVMRSYGVGKSNSTRAGA
jgi:hypothetical protein